MLAIVYSVQIIDYRSRSTFTGNEYAAETDWSKEQDKGKVSKGGNTKRQNRSIQMSSLNDTREKILPFKSSVPFNRWSSKLVGTLPEMVQTIVPKDFTQYCSSPPLCTMISYGYILFLWNVSFAIRSV